MYNLGKIKVKALGAITKAYKRGLINVFGAGVINKIFALLTNVVIVRLLSKNSYGVFSYAFNIITIVIIFSSLGMDMTILQFCSEEKDTLQRQRIYKFSFYTGLLANIMVSVAVLIFSSLVPLSIPEGKAALTMMSFLCIPQFLFSAIINFYRVELDNRRYGFTTNVNTICYCLGACIGAWLSGITGTIVGRYIAFIVAVVYGAYFAGNNIKDIFRSPMMKVREGVELIKYGITIVITNAISQILYSLDILLVGIVIGTTVSVADYKTATLIPFALNFIPSTLMMFVYPYFARNKDNKSWVKLNLKKIFLCLTPLNLLISFIGIVLAPVIIRVLFGVEYLSMVGCFRILMVSYFFSASLTIPAGNVLAMLRKVKINLVLGIISSVFNIAMDLIMIKLYGSIGAAIATTSITLLSGILGMSYLIFYLSHGELNRKQDLINRGVS